MRIKQLGVAAGIAALATVAGATTYRYMAEPSGVGGKRAQVAVSAGQGQTRAAGSKAPGLAGASSAETGKRGTFMVLFREAPLATYKGIQPTMVNGKRRIDSKSAQARGYVAYLQGRQQEIGASIEQQIGRKLVIRGSMQHALNAIVTDLTRTEAKQLRANPNVQLVEAYTEYALDTDRGPALIGATPVWTGSNPGAAAGYQGEGMVLGIIDSGINFESPSFAGTGPVDGYVHVNPRGAGNYLGTCVTGQVDAGRCNDKLIGGYDFVCDLPANQCGQANVREEPGFGDSGGHGSHTASTAGGNRRDVSFRGNTIRISGVAPHANIIAYDVCYTNTSTGQGLCPSVSSAAAIDQATADNVDAINFSIGGGTAPWSEAVSIAFRNAVNANTFVSASAGNSGPGPNTMGHLQPWVSSTAAAQHGRGDFVFALTITAPTPVPAALQAVIVNEGTGGVAHAAAIPNTTPVRVSPNVDATNDGCNAGTAYPANFFAGAIAVIRRGSCAFTEKTANAATAGATAVVIANNAAGAIIPSVPGATIRVFGVTQADGDAVRNHIGVGGTGAGGINFPAAALTNVVDALASFSSRGPAGTFDLVKPDVTGPGVLVLAAVSPTTGVTGAPNVVELYSGTSMASPHQAGAAILVRQARPTWTVPEMKSALAMTADETVLLEDQVTPANGFAGGAGRIRVDKAINAGLVLNETNDRYIAADPSTGGSVSGLNQPSMASGNCQPSCTFVRNFRNTLSVGQSYRVILEGVSGRVSPRTLKVVPGQTAPLTITVIGSGLTPGVWAHGKVRLEAINARPTTTAVLHLPVAVKIPVPTTVVLNQPNISGAAGSDQYFQFTVPAGRPRLIVTTSGGTGDADLFVGTTMTTAFVCSSGGSTNAESCSITNPAAGTWYARINGYTAFTGLTLVAEHE